MNSTMPLALLLLVFMTGSLYFLIQAEGGINQTMLCEFRQTKNLSPCKEAKTEEINTIHQDKSSNPSLAPAPGASRFNRGSCHNDQDCVVGGCSSEVCTSKSESRDLVTTCEFSEDFPSETTHECGCTQGVCGWSER